MKEDRGQGRRGQVFSADIAIATVVFLFSLSIAFFLWNETTGEIRSSEAAMEMDRLGSKALDQLMRTPGNPEDWNYFTVVSPGLVSNNREINETKALMFIDLMNASNSTHYDTNRRILGLGEYNFYINATYLNGSIVSISGNRFIAGRKPESATDSLFLYRTAIFNQSIIRINFVIWRA